MTRVASIGAGYWGRNLVRKFNDLGVLATVCDASPETLNELAQKFPGCTVHGLRP